MRPRLASKRKRRIFIYFKLAAPVLALALSSTGCSGLARQKAQEALATGFEKAKAWVENLFRPAGTAVSGGVEHKGDGPQNKIEPLPDENPLADRGRAIYNAHCARCHGPNPKVPGVGGPDTAGASLELLTARITQGTYPPGYNPKSPTKNMNPIPQLEKEQIEAVFTYLSSIK